MTQKCQEKSLALNLDIASEKHSFFLSSLLFFFFFSVNLSDNTEKHNPPATSWQRLKTFLDEKLLINVLFLSKS